MMTPSIIYADLEYLIKRIDGWIILKIKKNSEKSFTTKVDENIPCGYSVSTMWIFDVIENKHDV